MDLSHLSVRRRRFAEDNLYSFTGLKYQCVRAWFDNIEMVADMIHEADHSVLLKFAVHNLIDGSERWYKTHQHNLTTWSDFKQRMIKQFDPRIPPSGTDFIVSSQTPMKERRRTIAWHPQHVAHYKSYHSKKSSVVDHQPALSVPHFSMFQLDPFEVTWPPGDQSWVDTEPKPQRSNFALKPRQELIQNVIADAVTETQPHLFCVEEQPGIPINTPTSHSESMPLILHQRDTCISTAGSCDGERFTIVHKQLRSTTSLDRHRQQVQFNQLSQLVRLLGNRFAHVFLLVVSVLARAGIVYSSTNYLIRVGEQSLHSGYQLINERISPTSSPNHFTPFISTIETLRHLESLLIYPIT